MNIFSRARKKISNSYWLSSGIYTLLSRASIAIFAFTNFYILIRILPKEDFGAWILFTSVSSFMELIKHGFVRSPLVFFLATAEPEDSPKIQTSSIFLNGLFGLAEIALLIVFSFFLSAFWDAPQLKSLFLIYILTTIAYVPVNHLDIVQQARKHFKGTFFSTFFRQFTLFAFTVVVFWWDLPMSLDLLAYAQFLSVVFSGVVAFYFSRPFVHFSKEYHWDKIWALFHYGKFTFGTNASSTILKNIDSWMLGKLMSPAAVTLFNPAIRMSNLVEVPTYTLTSIMVPKLLERIKKEGVSAAKYLYEKSVGTITAVMFPFVVIIIIFSGPITFFIAGPGFEETAPILQLTMLYGLIIPFNRFFGITLEAIGKAKTNFSFVLRNAGINAVSNLFYISYFGVIGAAYGTLTTYVIVLVYNQVYLHRNLNVRISGILKHFLDFYRDAFFRVVKFF